MPNAFELFMKLAEKIEPNFEMSYLLMTGILDNVYNDNSFMATRHFRKMIYYFDYVSPYAISNFRGTGVVESLIGMLKELRVRDEAMMKLQYLFYKYPDRVKNALLNALNNGDISKFDVGVVIYRHIRNSEAYYQYILKKRNKNFSYIPSLSSGDMDKVSDCCKASLKIGEPTIAIKDKGKKSIHALSCPKVKPIYWSY